MFVQNLNEKLSDSTEDLAKILDCIYKFPQSQRKQYFQKITALKNQLAGLKSNLKESNALQTERQYNTLILVLTSLRNQIQDQRSINSNKENRNSHQSGFIRESRRTHEEALRLIAQKDEEIDRLKLQIFEKEELIRINYEELKDYQRDCYYLTENNKNIKRSIKQYEKELVSMNSELTAVSREVVDLRHLSEDQDMQLRMNSQIIQKNTNQLMLARDRIFHFQQLADLNMRKASLVEQNVRKIEQQAATLSDNYKQKQEQSLRREKEIESLNMQLRQKQSMIERLSDENIRLVDETSLMEKQINLLQKSLYDQRKQSKQEKQSLQDQISELYLKVRDLQTEKKEKLAQLQLCQNRFIEVYQRCEEREFEKEALQKQMEQLRIIEGTSQQKLEQLASSLETVQKQNLFLKKQKDILSQQVEKAISMNKQSQTHIQQLKQKIKNYQVQRLITSQKASANELQLKQSETAKINYEITLETFRRQINGHKEKIIMLEDEKKSSERIVLDIRKRLLRAKIEAVREIRVTMSE